ncbi:PD-(D/E)XK motif protein [Arthrobacter sp. I2-34]|uniref:PD-(D/E)XK motif protein n=1 Tax=Arthrobacter hankyongi TaxID=2904801 RepID=A0ABS9L2I4_9MICC|nr:PD-(D/E)XK motif protein [Arthrobacter hankyongi]MCG2620858.1 PD-(D/E)XK motif protein [Arthrobacter hankyongi]
MHEVNKRFTEETLNHFLSLPTPTLHVVGDSPHCELLIDPPAHQMSLLMPDDRSRPTATPLRHIDVTLEESSKPTRLIITAASNVAPGATYGLLHTVAVGLQNGLNVADALEHAVKAFKELIQSHTKLSVDQQVGLVGELLVLDRLVSTIGPDDAVAAWLGPLTEQHDFALGDIDVEVKTTTSEKRKHVISGIGQLAPNPGRELWLVSLQLTRAGGAPGWTLPETVERVMRSVHEHAQAVNQKLEGLGWYRGDSDLYPDRWMWRSDPKAYVVDEKFPALTTARLSAAVPRLELISDLHYRIDVSGLIPGTPHPALNDWKV